MDRGAHDAHRADQDLGEDEVEDEAHCRDATVEKRMQLSLKKMKISVKTFKKLYILFKKRKISRKTL